MMILILAMLGCTTHVGVASTSAVDKVQIVKGHMPMENAPSSGMILANGTGSVQVTTPYVLGRRFWVVTETPEGERSITKIRNQAKAAPIVGCVVGTVAAGLLGSWGCLYVSGPATSTQVQSPAAE